jgi:hypothetical protein
MADFLHLSHYYGGLDKLKGKKIAVTWAYSPSYGKPLSVPQGVIGLASRFGMEISLAYPAGYDLLPEVIETSRRQARESVDPSARPFHGRSIKDADSLYPKSGLPTMSAQRVPCSIRGSCGLKVLEKSCLADNRQIRNGIARREDGAQRQADPNFGQGLYMLCPGVGITGVSCMRAS